MRDGALRGSTTLFNPNGFPIMRAPSHRLLVALFVLALCGGFVAALLPAPEAINLGGGRDKIAHMLAFAGFALFGFTVWPARVPSACGALLTYGLAIELAQATTGHRSGDPLDWLADALGVALALALRAGWTRLRPAAT